MIFDYTRKRPQPLSSVKQRREYAVHKNKKQSFRVILLFIVLIAGIALSLWLLFRQARWNGEEQLTLILASPSSTGNELLHSIQILVVRPKESTALLFPLPENLYIDVLKGYGLYKSSALFGLAEMEKLSEQFVRQSLAMSLGIDIQETILEQKSMKLESMGATRSLVMRSLIMQNRSTLQFIERYRLWRVLSKLRQDQLSMIDPFSSSLFLPIAAVGDGQALGLDVLRFDALAFKLFANPSLRKEQISVTIVNTTYTTGMATKVARALSSMGVDIVHISSLAPPVPKTTLYIASQEVARSATAGTIQRTLNIDSSSFEQHTQKTEEFRADIVIFLGEDMVKLFGEKQE